MKRFLFAVYATVFLGCFLGKAQVSRSNLAVVPNNPITIPTNISQFEVSGRLITQNAFVGTGAIPVAQQTGNFGTTARWNSMGSLSAGLTQILNGFRTQTDGRGLTTGYSVAAGVLSNPTIQWIGNLTNAGVQPGNLEFKYAANPGSPGNPQQDFNIFTMAPQSNTSILPFSYATKGALLGQLEGGSLGSFGLADTWSATGSVVTPSLTSYGTRHQYEGVTFNSGVIKDVNTQKINAVMDYGRNANLGAEINSFKFRYFTDPTSPNSIQNIWQSQSKFANVVFGRQDINAVNSANYYVSLFDGVGSNATNIGLNFISRAGIYATADGTDPNFGNILNSYAAIVGDVSSITGVTRYGILGIDNGTSNDIVARWAGYFVGDLGYTGNLINTSDRKFKTNIKNEENILPKLMQLQPKNYLFDNEKFKNAGFSTKLQHGLISQEVELVFPELVQEAFAPNTSKDPKEDGKPIAYKGLNYLGFIPMLLKGIQELKIENDELKARLQKIENTNTNTLVLNDKLNLPADIANKAFSLSQNTPNPFSEKTTITYSIPTNTEKAVLAIFDMTGKLLQQYNLLQGKNQLVINGNTLQAGMYIYSLLANGQEVVSKRMVLTN